MTCDGFGAERRKQGAPFFQMRGAVLAHHVLSHEHRHQSSGLIRGKHFDPLLVPVNVVAPHHQDRVKFRYICDRSLSPHPCQRGIGVCDETFQVDMSHRWAWFFSGFGHFSRFPSVDLGVLLLMMPECSPRS